MQFIAENTFTKFKLYFFVFLHETGIHDWLNQISKLTFTDIV